MAIKDVTQRTFGMMNFVYKRKVINKKKVIKGSTHIIFILEQKVVIISRGSS